MSDSRTRRVLRWGLRGLGGVVLLIALVVLFLHTGPGKRFVRGRIESAAAERLNGTLQLGRLDYALFGDLTLGGVVVTDAAGKEVLRLDELTVAPAWGALLRGDVVLDRVALHGVRLNVVKFADGSSNLQKLVKPKPKKPSKPSGPKKARFVALHALDVSDVSVTVTQPNGDVLSVKNLAVVASLSGVPAEKTVTLDVSRFGADIEKKSDKLTLAVTGLSTGLGAKLSRGAGTVTLRPTKAHLVLARKDAPRFEKDVSLGELSAELGPGELDATLDGVALGILALSSLSVRGRTEGAALSGEQSATLVGLTIDHGEANALLGREVLASDLKLAGKISGPPEALALSFDLGAGGAELKLSGTADAKRLEDPGYDVALNLKDLRTEKLLGKAMSKVPPVELDRLALTLKGRGIKKDKAAVDIHLELGPLRAKGITVKRAVLEARFEKGRLEIKSLLIEALQQEIRAKGSYRLADKMLSLDVEPTADVGRAIAELRAAGIPLRSRLPPGAVRVKRGELTVHVEGRVDQSLEVTLSRGKIHVAGGVVRLDVNASLQQKNKKMGLQKLDGTVELSGLDVGALAALSGKPVRGVDGTLSGRVKLSGTREAPKAKIALNLDTGRRGAMRTEIRGTAGKHRVDLTLVARERNRESEVARVEASVPLASGKLGQGPVRLYVDVPKKNLSELSKLLPDAVAAKLARVPDGSVAVHADISGTTKKPEGSFDVDLVTDAVPGVDAHQRVNVHGTLSDSKVEAKIAAWLDESGAPLATGNVEAELRRDPNWKIDLALRPPPLEKLPPALRKAGLGGKVEVDAHLAGNRHDATGTVELRALDVTRGGKGPITARAVVKLEPDVTRVDTTVAVAGVDTLQLNGTVGVAGTGVLDRAREKKLGDPALALVATLPKTRLSAWSELNEKLAGAPGSASGRVAINGTVKEPLVDGGITVDGFETAAGGPGRASLTLSATHDAVDVGLGLGAPSESTAPVSVALHAPRAELTQLLRQKDAAAELSLTARANAVTLSTLVPEAKDRPAGFDGQLDWNMDGRFRLEAKDGKKRLAKGTLDGTLALTRGVVTLPGTTRKYKNVELRLSSNDTGLSIDALTLHESDLQVSDRRLSLTGRVGWKNLKPETVALRLESKDWLLFGTELLGKPDAPRATLNAKIAVRGDVSQPLRTLDTTVEALDMDLPERFEKAHWPEETDLGDIAYLGAEGVTLGKLTPNPGFVHPAPPELPAPPPKQTPVALEPLPESGLVINVHLPNTIHVHKPPFELKGTGELRVVRRPGAEKPEIRGELALSEGAMQLGGRLHTLDPKKKSRIVFDADNPRGAVDFFLVYAPNPAMLRDVSKVSAGGDVVHMRLEGPISKPVATVRGVANADLWDMLPVYNAGTLKWKSEPGLPTSETVQIPREYDVILLSYMALNLPHNLFMDRVSAWADPYDGPNAYGKIRHLEAERYSKSGKMRVRATARPQSPGRSDSELELDYMLLNEPRVKAGAGVAAGNRVGGGPALFFEWSSDD